jgi:hypothetical protein
MIGIKTSNLCKNREAVEAVEMDYISEPIRQLCQERDIEVFEVGPTPEPIAC